jgi:hypothetical protein
MSNLDAELSGGRSRSHRWLESQVRRGAERADLLAALLAWVSEKGSAPALCIAGVIYATEATRTEFEAFERLASKIPGGHPWVERVRHEVFSRALR